MDPQTQNSAPQDTQAQNAPSAEGETPNIDGFGGPNIVYENYSNDAIKENQKEQDASSIPINVINAVNANGIVSGRKVVDYIWKRGAICLMVLAMGLLVGLIIVLWMMSGKNADYVALRKEKDALNNNCQGVLTTLGASTKEEALARIANPDILDGGDLIEVNKLLAEKFGASYKLDLMDQNINFVRKSGYYNIVSLGVQRPGGSVRAILYKKVADGKWVMSSFDSAGEEPCASMEDDEKTVLSNIIVCEVQEEESE